MAFLRLVWFKAYLHVPALAFDQDCGVALGIAFDLGECFLDLGIGIGQHFITLLICYGAVSKSDPSYKWSDRSPGRHFTAQNKRLVTHIGAHSQDHGSICGLEQITSIAIEVAFVIDLLRQNLLAGLGIDHRTNLSPEFKSAPETEL